MYKPLLLLILNLFLFHSQTKAQCIDTLPANTIIITADTTLSNSNGMNNYLICPNVNVTYNGLQSTFNTYYLEEGALLNINAYHYPQVYLQATAEVDANHSTANPPSLLMSPTAEFGAVFTDTIDSYTDNVTWCSNLVYEYSNLPGGVGCPANNPPCVEVLPANTIVLTSDTVITNATGSNNYLICPNVNVTYSGGQSTFNNYYLEDSAFLDIDAYHYPQVYLQSTAEIDANHSTANPPSYLMNPMGEYGATFTDTLDALTGNVTWCTTLTFDYSNLPGGVGCPANNPPCVEVLPANTIVITSDTTINNANGMSNYLICPNVNVIYTGGQSTFINYYLESGAFLEIDAYHYPQIYMQATAEVDANHSSANPPSYIMNSLCEFGAIFTDTLTPYMGNLAWCSDLVFDYSNLPGGLGCPVMTNLDNILAPELVQIYPNPAKDYLIVALAEMKVDYNINIVNSLGQTVYQQVITQQKQQIDLTQWQEKGIYFLSILNEQNKPIIIKKIILQ